MSTLRLRGARVFDPMHGEDGVLRDVCARDGRLVDIAPDERVDSEFDARGMVVMAGGIDMHSHIGGGKVNLARMLMPELHRHPATSRCTPGTLATGHRYAQMGYTAVFEPAMLATNARHTHFEMGDVPIVDHGAYVMLGNDELFLRLLAERADFERVRDYVGWTINAAKALGVKVVNPGGISAFKFNQRKLDVDQAHVHYGITPRRVVHTLARALAELGIPHALHIHASNLGVPGNIESTLATIAALEGLPAHLTHVQFHSYGTEGARKFSSAARRLAEAVNAHPEVSIDVGQIIFGQTVTASGDTMRQAANAELASPRKWISADIECDAGCGVVPFRYREQSFVNALQWAIGLELFLLVKNPWQVALTTDHPNGGPFSSYPHLIRLLMDKPFRDEQLASLHPEVATQADLKHIKRELSLTEVAILTRAAPARLLGLRDRGRLAPGAAADIAVYREDANRETMFATPALVFKDGELVARDGEIVAAPAGSVHFVEPEYDRAIERTVSDYSDKYLATAFRHAAIGRDELCECCNPGGKLLLTLCMESARERAADGRLQP